MYLLSVAMSATVRTAAGTFASARETPTYRPVPTTRLFFLFSVNDQGENQFQSFKLKSVKDGATE